MSMTLAKPVPAGGLACPAGFIGEEYDASDFTFPRLRLLQPVSAEVVSREAAPGAFYHSLLGQSLGDEVDVVVVGMRKTRAAFEDKVLRCVSYDFRSGRGVPGGDCAGCPEKEWGPVDPATNKPRKPACSVTYNYVVLPRGLQGPAAKLPALLQLTRSGSKTARKLNSALATYSPPWGLVIRLRSVQTQSPKGTFYATAFALADTVPEEELAGYAEVARLVQASLAVNPASIEHTADDAFPEDEGATPGEAAGGSGDEALF